MENTNIAVLPSKAEEAISNMEAAVSSLEEAICYIKEASEG